MSDTLDGSFYNNVVGHLSQFIGIKKDALLDLAVLGTPLPNDWRGLEEHFEKLRLFLNALHHAPGYPEFPEIRMSEQTARALAEALFQLTQEVDARDGFLERPMPVEHYRTELCPLHTKRLMAVTNLFFMSLESPEDAETLDHLHQKMVMPLIIAPAAVSALSRGLRRRSWNKLVGGNYCSEMVRLYEALQDQEVLFFTEEEVRERAKSTVRRLFPKIDDTEHKLLLRWVSMIYQSIPKKGFRQIVMEGRIKDLYENRQVQLMFGGGEA